MSGIWIRCQDKESMSSIVGMFIDEKFHVCGYDVNCNRRNEYWEMGEYSTREKAVKVLDMIQQHINDSNCEMYNRSVDADILGTIATQTNCVFQMPQDSEVIVDETYS